MKKFDSHTKTKYKTKNKTVNNKIVLHTIISHHKVFGRY